MAENMDINTTDPKTTPAQAAKTLMNEAWAANLDPQTSLQLTSLTYVRQARINQQQRELATLTTEFGSTDSDVVALQASIGVQQSLTSVLGTTRDIARMALPTVPTNGWVLQGHVRDGSLQPIATLTIYLADEQKNFLSSYGYAYTDATGLYTLPYTPDPSAPAPAPLSTYLAILNSSGQAIYIDPSAFTLNPGARLTRDLMLTSQTPLGSPPPGSTPAPFKVAKPKKTSEGTSP
jgi:hypothetical protein